MTRAAPRSRDFIGPYRLGARLGEGSFSTVYAACDPETGREVAVKLLEHARGRSLAAFRTEFQSIQDLHHPNIVRLESLLEHDGWIAIVMEKVPGTDLLRYVRPSDNDGGFDETRLRACFGQLAQALAALHAAGVVHRDIKPDNVRVTPEGRAVILDFGLVKHTYVVDEALDAPLVGTADYNAPEQVRGGPQGPAADLYALGVCLFECIAGVRPFHGRSPLEVMQLKQEREAPPLLALAPRTPGDLNTLCWRLLQRDATRRPDAREVVDILAGFQAPAVAAPSLTPPAPSGPSFQGRERERSLLKEKLWGPARAPRLLVVEGESGVGKSALVAEVLRELEGERPCAWVGRSRCYENEHLPLKAFDAAMAFFGRKLSLCDEDERRALLPRDFAALEPLFPALVAGPGLLPETVELSTDPSARKRLAIDALAELLARLCALTTVVLAIDDLQWADVESLSLLQSLASSPQGPWLLATVRPADERPAQLETMLQTLGQAGHVHTLSLQGLGEDEAVELASQLLGEHKDARTVEALVRESHGHPLWLQELAQFATSLADRTLTGLSLDDALEARLDALAPEQASLVQLLAVAAQPYPTWVLARALGTDEPSLQALAIPLLASRLLRRRGAGELACFHDRVREVAARGVSFDAAIAWHRALARALADYPRASAADLARHQEAAGAHEEALAAYQRAGEQALEGLSFDSAAHHFGRAIQLASSLGVGLEVLSALQTECGHALARGGHSALAAEHYLAAAEGVQDSQRLTLRSLAAQHLLQSAQLDAGLTIARAVLAELGEPLPSGEAAALARLAYDSLLLRVRGLALRGRDGKLDIAERTRLDAMLRLVVPIWYVHPAAGDALNARHLRRALAAGDPRHTARALASRAAVVARDEPDEPAIPRQLIARAYDLCAAEGDPAPRAWVQFMDGTAANWCNEATQACERLTVVEALVRARCSDEPWLLTQIRMSLAAAWFQRGQLGGRLETVDAWLAEAAHRNDQFATAVLETIGFCAMRSVLRDEPGEVDVQLERALVSWPEAPFSIPHLGALFCTQFAAMYRGGDHAWRLLEQDHARHQRALLLKAGLGKAALTVQRAQAALAARVAAAARTDGQLLRVATKQARALRRSRVRYARLYSPLIDAQIHALAGDADRALECAREAARRVAGWEYGLLTAPVEYLQGVLEGGEGGRARCAQALALAERQGWRNPRRFVAMDCPVTDWLQAR